MNRRSFLVKAAVSAAYAGVVSPRIAFGVGDEPVGDVALTGFGTARTVYSELERRRQAGRDIRSFGAKLDGIFDDTDAFEKAVASGEKTLLIPATADRAALRLTRQIQIPRSLTVIGVFGKSSILWDGRAAQPFYVGDPALEESKFVTDVWFDGLSFACPKPRLKGHAVMGVNVRNFRFTRNSTSGMGGIFVNHARLKSNAYKRSSGSPSVDPAVLAGFSATGLGDLNEDILVLDNLVDGGVYTTNLLRFNFARRVVAARNVGNYANISWWGGGAKINEGGAPEFLRRVSDVHIFDNKVNRSNGGIYGNCGQKVLIENNEVSDIGDTGIDFEGCADSVARNNIVSNCGNFCYSVFYMARNIKFIDNVGIQDGSAERINDRIGGKSIGKVMGRSLFALRTGGFRGREGAITVELRGNTFEWRGPSGLGNFTPSFGNELLIAENTFRNVTCNTSYPSSGRVEVKNNKFLFDQVAGGATKLISVGGNGKAGAIVSGNQISVAAKQPEGSIGIFAMQIPVMDSGLIEIKNNRIREEVKEALEFPIRISGAGADATQSNESFDVKDNQARSVTVQSVISAGVTEINEKIEDH